jgi:hypothetical protein
MKPVIAIVLLVTGSLGCTPLYRTEVVAADSAAFSQPTAPATLAVELPIAEASTDGHVFRYAVRLPSALELAWTVSCPGLEQSGVLGETFEAYRTRRLAELEEERQHQASLIGALVGAAVPSVQASGQAAGPGFQAGAQGRVDPGQVAAAAAYGASPAPQLPAGDVGARIVEGEVELGAVSPGSCVLTLRNARPEQDVSGVVVDVALDRTIDIAAEEQTRMAAVEAAVREAAFGARASLVVELQGAGATERTVWDRQQAALALRGSWLAVLVEAGADPGLRARERAEAEAERQRRAQEDEARRRERLAAETARLQVELELQQQRDQEAYALRLAEQEGLHIGLALRADVQGWLIGFGADPLFRRRLWEENERRRQEEWQAEVRLAAEARVQEAESTRAGLTLRFDVADWLVGLGADPAYRQRVFEDELRRQAEETALLQARFEAGLDLRGDLALQLVSLGAVVRPPQPPAPIETPPPPPFAGAVWVEGGHVWYGGAWIWVAGQYASVSAAGTLQLGPLAIDIGGGAALLGGSATIEVGTAGR